MPPSAPIRTCNYYLATLLATLSHLRIKINKKDRLGKPFWHLDLLSRGNRIQTYDLVLPKHPVRNLRQTPQETSEAIAYELV